MSSLSRRSFLGCAGLAAAACVTQPVFGLAMNPPSPFKIAVINNEISEDGSSDPASCKRSACRMRETAHEDPLFQKRFCLQ